MFFFECMWVCRAITVHFTFQITPEKKVWSCYVQRTRRPWHITETRNHPLLKQTARRSDAYHSRVGRSTILLKPQGTTVWWKLRGKKFIDHLCVTLRRDCVRADHLGLRLTVASTRAMLSGVRTEDGRPRGFLHVTEPS